MTIVRVAIDVPVPTLFDYRADLDPAPAPGTRVEVPFGRRRVIGIVLETAAESAIEQRRLRRVTRVLADTAPLDAASLDLVRFCSGYYHHPIGETALATLPSRLRTLLPGRARVPVDYLPTPIGNEAEALAPPRKGSAAEAVWRMARSGRITDADVAALSPAGRRALKSLIERGWLAPVARALADPGADWRFAPGPALNRDQQAALDAITAAPSGFRAWLLHGITGSGKTEVYFHLIARALAAGGQALVLVPEINLTPQLESRFRTRFPGVALVCLHSGLAAGERAASWRDAQSGRARVVLGTRSAVFVPLPALRLVIVDEEHDGSFKQIEGMRYHARDLAVWRARRAGAVVVLGSATPALETWQRAAEGRYRLLSLPRRANDAPLPQVRMIPTRGRTLTEGLSIEVIEALRARFQRGEQALVFINRRGYAPVLLCHACNWSAACHRCSARLVLHAARRELVCHHCGHRARVLGACPDCGNVDLRPLGQGTQRIEAALAQAVPGARILRVDRDATRRRNAWDEMRLRIERREVDILVGTQLMAKGHDFPGLSLVCVLDADRSLYSTDFRAGEQLFAQLMQVAGRAGRGDLAGEVLIQSELPEHPLYHALVRHDYAQFAQALLDDRRVAGFPPFVHQALLRAEAPRAEPVFAFLQTAAQIAQGLAEDGVEVYDPVACVMQRLKGQERAQLLVQSGTRAPLHRFLDAWIAALRDQRVHDVRWVIDVDPLDV